MELADLLQITVFLALTPFPALQEIYPGCCTSRD